ncbi:MAG: HD domain-containing protein [Halanaerobiaceae bacterium]|nr:HD domain-containing protein [Halanaerobiaceae bacterium]
MPFSKVAAVKGNDQWDIFVKRQSDIYQRLDDIRSDFWRDYNRILHCTAYRRLKHKTQVFFATRNDHICTRIEHVNHVASVSATLCKKLSLNVELAVAIATGHDLGHAPFGHEGEKILREIVSI